MRILSLNVWGGMLHAPLLDYLAAVDVFVSSHVKLRPVILLAGRPARINTIAPPQARCIASYRQRGRVDRTFISKSTYIRFSINRPK